MSTAPAAAITPLNPPPKRFDGVIHDTVTDLDEQGRVRSRTTVIGSGNPDGNIDVSAHADGLGLNLSYTPIAAVRLGQMLIAAGTEALRSFKTCEEDECANLPIAGKRYCEKHKGIET